MALNPLHQPQCRVPLDAGSVERALDLGVIGLSCWLRLWVQAEGGLTVPVTFLVDSGAFAPMMNLEEAESRGLSVPPPEAEIDRPLITAQGHLSRRFRPGRIRA